MFFHRWLNRGAITIHHTQRIYCNLNETLTLLMHNCHVKFKFSMCLFNIPCKLLSCACGPYIGSLIPVIPDALRLHFTLFYRQFGNLGNTRQRSKKKLTDPWIRISHKLCEFLVRNSKTDVLEDCLQIEVKPAKSGSTEAVWWYLYMKREISQKKITQTIQTSPHPISGSVTKKWGLVFQQVLIKELWGQVHEYQKPWLI